MGDDTNDGSEGIGESLHVRLLDLHHGALVCGRDGELGPVLAIVVDPVTKTATEVAVRNGDVAGTGRLVPVGAVVEAAQNRLSVDVSRDEFFALPRFLVPYRSESLSAEQPAPDEWRSSDVWWIRPGTFLLGVHENVAAGELPIRRGLGVRDRDGRHIGSVESWNVEIGSGRLASVAIEVGRGLRRRHLLADSSSIASIDEEALHLTLSADDLRDSPAAS